MKRPDTTQLMLFRENNASTGDIPPVLEGITEKELISIAVGLGAKTVPGWSPAEERLHKRSGKATAAQISEVRRYILAGRDPLGAAFGIIRQPEERRTHGATFTPWPIVDSMVDWAASNGNPARVVDPGTGSARYLVRAARQFPKAALIGVDVDPLCAAISRANLAVVGAAPRSKIILGDFRDIEKFDDRHQTLFIGNPPYVRHHLIGSKWKEWLAEEAGKLKLSASQLAGLHVHFFLATVLNGRPGDYGAFITAAEWLDVNYGSLVRELFLGPLGGKRIVIVEPTARPFPDAATTAAVTYFELGAQPKSIKLKRIARIRDLSDQNKSRTIRRERLEIEKRWSHLTHSAEDMPAGFIELGELCRVHRGQVTGSNKIWIAGEHSKNLPESVLFPTVTKARELFCAGGVLNDASGLKRVIDLPVDLDCLANSDRKVVEAFLRYAKRNGAHEGYVAANRKAWWAVGLKQPAPILATYMARRPPAFVHNRAEARHINIAHGLYPREPISPKILNGLIEYLGRTTELRYGRTYAGGLTKFEPREMERLPIPSPEMLASCAA